MRGSWLVSLLLSACLGLSGTVGVTTLSVGQLAAHRHSCGIQSSYKSTEYNAGGVPHCDAGTSGYTGDNQPHTHSLAGPTGPANNLPPYYSLAYIMRVA